MKKIDWYIIKKFLGAFFFMIAAFCVIAVVFDLSENVDDLITNHAPFYEIIVDYYLNFCLHFGNMLSAFIVFIAIILITSGLAQRSEIIAMLSGGVSFNRLLRPFFIASTFLVILSLLIAHILLPEANKVKVDFEFTYIHTRFHISDQHLYREIEPGTIAYFRSITAEREVGYKFALENWEDGRMTRKIMASKAKSLGDNKWKITNARIRDIYQDGTENVRLVGELDTVLNMAIEDFGQRSEIISTMNYHELNDYIAEVERKGSGNMAFVEIEKYSRTSNAFAIYVLTLIGVSIAARKVRGGTGVHLFFAIIIGLTYIFTMKIMTVAATNAGLAASIAVWVPNVLFFILGLIIYARAPK
ncbi:MAG: lipopolysaccharide export system permease protein [Flavobacteriales bacterium]|jgi:lipopolysaccharide export system permease protein